MTTADSFQMSHASSGLELCELASRFTAHIGRTSQTCSDSWRTGVEFKCPSSPWPGNTPCSQPYVLCFDFDFWIILTSQVHRRYDPRGRGGRHGLFRARLQPLATGREPRRCTGPTAELPQQAGPGGDRELSGSAEHVKLRNLTVVGPKYGLWSMHRRHVLMYCMHA